MWINKHILETIIMSDEEKHLNIRPAHKQWITKSIKFIKGELKKDQFDYESLQIALNTLKQRIQMLDDVQTIIEQKGLIAEEHLVEDTDSAFDFRQNALKTCLIVENIIEKNAKEKNKDNLNVSCMSGTSENTANLAKLPKLELPSFGGDVKNWQSFNDQFKAVIDDNTSLPDITKFAYLQSLLRGEALYSIKGLPLTAENYQAALKLLRERFGRKETIIFNHLQELLTINHTGGLQVANLRHLEDNLLIHIRCLEGLNIGGQRYGVILTPLILSRLPPEIRLEWARVCLGKEADLDFLLKFLHTEIESRERANTFSELKGSTNPKYPKHYQIPNHKNPSATALVNSNNPKRTCSICQKGNHTIEQCHIFLKNDKKHRKDLLKKKGICFKCLSHESHNFAACKKVCKFCSGKHHSTICLRNETVLVSQANNSQSGTILQTIQIKASGNMCHKANILFDTGSNTSYISSKLVKQINPNCLGTRVLGYHSFGSEKAGNEETRKVREVELEGNKKKINIKLVEVKTICCQVFQPIIPQSIVKTLKKKGIDIELRNSTHSDIDILIGLDFYWSLMTTNIVPLTKDLVAQESKLGWILSGKFPQPDSNSDFQGGTSLICLDDLPEDTLSSFWDLESLGITDDPEVNIDPVVLAFEASIVHKEGRYHVSLPWKPGFKDKLQNNLPQAKARLVSLNNRMTKHPELSKSYHKSIKDMLLLNMIEEVPKGELQTDLPVYYLPHHPVLKKDSITTKVRPVFDASCSSQNGISLNDCLYAGPSLIPNLPAILIRFRRWKYAVTADITKAFLQVGINTIDQNVHRFLWNDEGTTRIMRFTRVPFGNKSSPFLLNATLHHHLGIVCASRVTEEMSLNLYVDDLITGNDDELQACKDLREAQTILGQAGMQLDKIGSNSKDISDLVIHEFESKHSGATSCKVLGLKWLSLDDCFTYDTFPISEGLVITKRIVLSAIARLFDPLGFLSPVIMLAKILFQELWKLGLDWDSSIPDHLQREFSEWIYGLEQVKELKIERSYTKGKAWGKITKITLHSFGDASEKGYGACVYLVCKYSDKSAHSSLVMSKGKVNPIKTVTLPRLELLASLICARLLKFVKSSLLLESPKVYCWTDSMISLGWIKNKKGNLKPFVENRCDEIKSITTPEDWNHCPGEENPADLITRGLSMTELLKNPLWLKGPSFILKDVPTPDQKKNKIDEDIQIQINKELKGKICHSLVTNAKSPDMLFDASRWSTFTKAMRIMAWVLRFINNLKRKKKGQTGDLNLEELEKGKECILQFDQRHNFPEEYKEIKKGKSLQKSSKLYKLNPFLDEKGLLRVKSRLQRSLLSYNEKFPLLIPNSHIGKLLIRFQHKMMKHVGIDTLLVTLRNEYHIIKGRRTAKAVKDSCIHCLRQDTKSCDNPFAPLPELRITPSPPFSVVGIDHTGVLFCSDFPNKKFYILLATCAVIRAVHLELVESLNTQDVVLALRRLFARRGLASTIFSDNAKAFDKAPKVLAAQFGPSAPKWKHIVPRAPWWGGWWERLNHPIKQALKKSIGLHSCTKSELETYLIEIEACINSRPLTFVGQEVNAENPLTPAHFLMGRCPLVPSQTSNFNFSFEETISSEDLVNLKMCQHELLDSFWNMWSSQYLRNLPSSSRTNKKTNLKCGSVVLIQERGCPRLKWPLGLIKKVHIGSDGLFRAVDVKTASGMLTRPIQLIHDMEMATKSEFETLTSEIEPKIEIPLFMDKALSSNNDNNSHKTEHLSKKLLTKKKGNDKSSAEPIISTRRGRRVVPPPKLDL